MTVIDVHTHMLSRPWLDMLRQHGAPRHEVKQGKEATESIFLDGAPFMTTQPGHFDYDLRIKDMDAARVDIAIVTLTCPNVYWGGPEVSSETAAIVNDEMAAAQTAYPDRVRWMASLPWEYPELAVAELARACEANAVGVMVLANVAGRSLTDELFQPIWAEIDRRALPVLVHPTAPPGNPEMDMTRFNLIASMGFMFDTSLAFARIVYSGFLDRYPNLKLIASHAGAALPYLVGRLDICHERMNACREAISEPPAEYLRRIYYDSVTYRQDALELCLSVGGDDKVLYGSDYPHNIGDMAGCLGRVDALSAPRKQAVRAKNAERIFNL